MVAVNATAKDWARLSVQLSVPETGTSFYFVSEAPKFKNYFFLCVFFLFFLWFFSNLQISMVLTMFLHRMDGLLIKYEMMKFFPGFFPDFTGLFRIFPDFHKIFRFLHRMDSLRLINYLIIFFSRKSFRLVSGFWFPVFFWFFCIFPDFHLMS